MKAIIIGGGIGGLTTAIALEQAGVNCEVHEAAKAFREVGAGILLAPNATQVLDRIGLLEEVEAAGSVLHGGAITSAEGRVISIVDLARLNGEGELKGVNTVAIHRGRLQSILLSRLENVSVHTGKRLERYEEFSDGVRAIFDDGTTAEGDVLLAADGIHSAVRGQMFPDSKLRFSGQTCWRGIANVDAATVGGSMSREMWGGKLRFGFAPISETEVYWFAVAVAAEGGVDEVAGLSKKLEELYAGFAAPVPILIAHTADESIIRGDICDLKRVASWHRGRVLLLGDAAHATTPNMGQGACQAIEDAWQLSLLAGKSRNWEAIFPEFEQARRAKVDAIVKNSWRMGKIAHWEYGKGLRNLLFRMTPESTLSRSLQRLYTIAN